MRVKAMESTMNTIIVIFTHPFAKAAKYTFGEQVAIKTHIPHPVVRSRCIAIKNQVYAPDASRQDCKSQGW